MLRNITLFSFLLLFILSFPEASRPSPSAGPEAVLFVSRETNDAMLVKKADEVEKLTAQVLNNSSGPHACEGEWKIAFRFPDGSVKTLYHNQDHEIYVQDNEATHKLLNGFFARLQEQPNEDKKKMARLAVAADTPIDEAASALKNSGEEVFFFGDAADRLPGIVLTAKAAGPSPADKNQWRAAEQKASDKVDALLEKAIETLKKWNPMVSQTPIRFQSGSIRTEGYETKKALTIYFRFGINLSEPPPLPDGVSLSETFAPKQYYIDIALPADKLEALSAELPKKYPFVRSVEPSPFYINQQNAQ